MILHSIFPTKSDLKIKKDYDKSNSCKSEIDIMSSASKKNYYILIFIIFVILIKILMQLRGLYIIDILIDNNKFEDMSYLWFEISNINSSKLLSRAYQKNYVDINDLQEEYKNIYDKMSVIEVLTIWQAIKKILGYKVKGVDIKSHYEIKN